MHLLLLGPLVLGGGKKAAGAGTWSKLVYVPLMSVRYVHM